MDFAMKVLTNPKNMSLLVYKDGIDPTSTFQGRVESMWHYLENFENGSSATTRKDGLKLKFSSRKDLVG